MNNVIPIDNTPRISERLRERVTEEELDAINKDFHEDYDFEELASRLTSCMVDDRLSWIYFQMKRDKDCPLDDKEIREYVLELYRQDVYRAHGLIVDNDNEYGQACSGIIKTEEWDDDMNSTGHINYDFIDCICPLQQETREFVEVKLEKELSKKCAMSNPVPPEVLDPSLAH